jgi:hypothetical protein
MTSQYDFTNEDWHRVATTPLLVGMAVARAEDSGFLGSIKETRTLLAEMSTSAADGPASGLISQAIATDTEADFESYKMMSAEALATDAEHACQWLNDLFGSVAGPDEAEGYKRWILDVAQRVAEAAKEQGSRVSDGERNVIHQVTLALELS